MYTARPPVPLPDYRLARFNALSRRLKCYNNIMTDLSRRSLIGPRRAQLLADPAIVERHRSELLGRLEDDLSEVRSVIPDQVDPHRPWSEFGTEAAHRNHARRVFVAKYNPGVWGEPDDPAVWAKHAPLDTWLWDSHSMTSQRPANSSPALRTIAKGDLIFVMRLRPTDPERKPVEDQKGYDGPVLLGVWVAVLVHRYLDPVSPLRTIRPGLRARLATEVWHKPLVRFDEEVRVNVIRQLDRKGIYLDPEFTEANVALVEVQDPDGNRTAAARLLAACSLPGDLLTCPDPLTYGPLVGKTGMRQHDFKYWKDMTYRHTLRTVAETIAVERSRENVLARGYDFPECWNHERDDRWGGDYECWPVNANAGPKKLAVEVKGTSRDPWLGKIKLQRSQYDRAIRHAAGRPLSHERDFAWELHVQAGIPVSTAGPDVAALPPLEIRHPTFIKAHWKQSWIDH